MKQLVLAAFVGALAPSLGACLERSGPELPGYSAHILARGERVPQAADDEALAMRIANNAGAMGPLVPLHTGFAGDDEVLYWDFGSAPSSAEPVWILERDGAPIDHPPIVDSLPGDSAYSPFRVVFTVAVTGDYDGEQIASLSALEDAIELGLVEEPVATNTFVSWPIVPADFTLERREGEPLTPSPTYCRGRNARYFALTEPAPLERNVPVGTAYELRRQGELGVLDEAVQGGDLNADGDELDSNVIYVLGAAPSGLWSPVELTVRSDYAFGTYRSEEDLFVSDEMGGSMPVPEAFIERATGEDTLYRPIHEVVTP